MHNYWPRDPLDIIACIDAMDKAPTEFRATDGRLFKITQLEVVNDEWLYRIDPVEAFVPCGIYRRSTLEQRLAGK